MKHKTAFAIITALTLIILSTTVSAYNAPRNSWLSMSTLKGNIDMSAARPTLAYNITPKPSTTYLREHERNWNNRYSNWMRTNNTIGPQSWFRTTHTSDVENKMENPRLHQLDHRLPTFNTKQRRQQISRQNTAEHNTYAMQRINKRFDYTARSLEDTITYGTKTKPPTTNESSQKVLDDE